MYDSATGSERNYACSIHVYFILLSTLYVINTHTHHVTVILARNKQAYPYGNMIVILDMFQLYHLI